MTTPPYGSPRTRPTIPGVRAVRPGIAPPPPAPSAAQTVDTKLFDWEDDPISGRPTVIPSVDPASFDLPSQDDSPMPLNVERELDIEVEVDVDEDHVDTWRAPPGPATDEATFKPLRPKAVSCPPPMSFDELDAFDSPLALAGERPTLPPVAPPSDNVAAATPRPPLTREERLADEMRARYAVGDFSGALTSADALLALSPSHREALKHAESCREVLCQMYTARLGSLIHVPSVVMSQDKVRWLSLDHRAGFLLACVDGFSTVEEILDVCGMSSLDALRILADLSDQKVIEVASR